MEGTVKNITKNSLLRAAFCLFLFLYLEISLPAQEKNRVKFSASITEVDVEKFGENTRRLEGNVVFIHGGAKMYCDSAYFYSDKNSLDAFSNVYINQGDTVHVYGDNLYYDGNTKIAKVRKDVKLINQETTLTTQALDYDISNGVGYYMNHADILNKDNQLESIVGYYYTKQDLFDFQDSVVVVNPDYTIYSDRMKYNTDTKTAFFNGPTEIVGDSNYIYCERGWYNTETDISQLNQNALVRNQKQTIIGDSLYYEKLTGYGLAIQNVEIIDNEQDIILRGDRAEYNEIIEHAVITERAQFLQVSNQDTLFLHADTLVSDVDTGDVKIIKAYYGVRIFKSNLQGRCDSMAYTTADSVIRLYQKPVLWSDESQISAEFIEIHTENKKAKTMFLYKSSFIVSKEDTMYYNQIKGKNMVCHFRKNEIYKIDVSGNGQTVYFPSDKDGLLGANTAVCSNLKILMKEGKPESITFYKDPDAAMHPLEKAPKSELRLKGFKWLENLRPLSKEEIFIK